MNRRFLALLAWLLFVLAIPLAAQETERSLSYGETVSAYFEDDGQHNWTFTGATGDIIEIVGRRIAGRFDPALSLIAPDGSRINELNYINLSQDGTYTIQVNQRNNQNNNRLILNEYSLSLNQIGKHRASIEEGLEPLPTAEALFNYFTGEAQAEATLGISLYGSANLSQPEPENARNHYLLAGENFNVSIDNANPIARTISAIAFAGDGIVVQSSSGAVFFSPQNISLAIEDGSTTITLADGTSLVTDFYRISSIQIRNDLLFVSFADGQNLVAQGQAFELLRRGGLNGEGPNVEAVNIIGVDGSRLDTDLAAWKTLALLGDDIRVYYDELRFLGDSPWINLFADETGIQIRASSIDMSIDPFGMGDVILRGANLRVQPLDGREIAQARGTVASLDIFRSRVTMRLKDGGTLLSLTDGTLIQSPAEIPVNALALPNQPDFRPRNFNNLGATLVDYHPMPDFDFALYPVNRVNGNFFYQATDFALENDVLPLEWTRSYNSLAATQAGAMGLGWRHSYQYELDLSYLPLGEIWLSLPDGSRHTFNLQNDVYRSDTLLSWMFYQDEDAHWQAFTSEGLHYDFGLSGQLHSISKDVYSLSFSPAPREYLGTYPSGFFVTDTYGRRLEIYSDSNGLIREVHDVLGREIRYGYTGNQLQSVSYSYREQGASYSYNEGLLVRIVEGQQNLSLQYEPQGRLIRYVQNPESDLQAVRSYVYAPNLTTESEFVSGTERQHLYSFDDNFRLVRYDTPRPEWSYRWAYSLETGRLSEVAQPDNSVLRYNYDEFGYLESFTDPIFGSSTGSYRFHYSSPDNRQRLLTAIDIPGIENYITFEYDSTNRLSVYSQSTALSPRQTSLTSYSYDEMGRIISISHPDKSISYSYDDFGYLSRINEADGARVINLSHDMLGRLLSETDGRGLLTSYRWSAAENRLESKTVGDWRYDYAYDAAGNLASVTFNGQSQSFEYDALNHLSRSIDAVGRVHEYRYDEAGNLLRHTLPDGRSENFSYDGFNFLSSYTDENGLVTRYEIEFTSSNRTIYRIIYPNGEASEFNYDPLGRVRQVLSYDRTGAASFSYNLSYNTLGNLTTIEELHVPAGRKLELTYDLQGQPLTAQLNNAATTSYSYNAAGYLESETDPVGRSTSYEYDVLGNLIRVTRPDATVLSYGYDENGNRISFTEAGGAEWFYTYDNHNRLSTVIDPANGLTSYEYDDFGNLKAIINPAGTRLELTYDEASRLTGFTDLAGNLISYQYNDAGNLSRVEQAGGLRNDFFYDAVGNLTALTQSGGRETLYSRDNEGRLVGLTDSLGFSSFYAYNTIGEIGRIINPLGNESTYRWSASGRIVGYTSSNGASYSYSGDNIGRLTNINDTGTNQTIALNTIIAYDAAGYIESVRIGTSGTIGSNQASRYQYTYTPNGQIASYQAPESDTPYRFEYDANGRMIRSTDPNGVITTYAYDVLGNITEIHRALDTDIETVERYSYDALGNIISYTAPDGLRSEYSYDSANRLTQRTDNGERVYTYEYDDFGRLSRSVDPNGNESNYRYDLYGNLIVLERGGLSTRYEYDEVNNLRRIQYPAGQSILMTYNAQGRRVRYTDAENNVWSYSYDDAGNLSQSTNPFGNSTAYHYDANNRLNSIHYPNNTALELLYDSRGWLSELRLPNEQRIRTSFDSAGNLSSVEYASNQVIRYERDNLGRITLQTNADGQTIHYAYDAQGRLINTDSPENSQSMSYDAAGRLSQISQGTSAIRYEYNAYGELTAYRSSSANVSYNYDAVGNLLLRNAGDFGTIEYEYDTLYRPTRITMGMEWVAIEYDENGWRSRLERSNGVETRYVYDGNGRIRNILHLKGEERLDGFAYEYDAVGNILRVTRIDNWAVLYSYDDAQNLISERWLSADNQVRYSVSYGYDEAGNRSERITRIGQGNPERTLFVYNNQNQLIEEIRNAEFTIEDRMALPVLAGLTLLPLAWHFRRKLRYLPIALAIIPFGIPLFQGLEPPSIAYRYDQNGNLSSIQYTNGNTLQFSYDSFQRLTTVTGTNDTGTVINSNIRYDALGRVIEINESDTVYNLVYDAFGLLGIESDGKLTLMYQALGDTLLQSSDSNLWPLQDALGMVRSAADASGAWLPDYGLNSNSLGEVINPYENSTSLGSIEINGSYYLPQAQLYLRGERAYEPRLGFELQRPALPDVVFQEFNPLAGGLAGLAPLIPDLEPIRLVENPTLAPVTSFTDVHSAQAAETERLLTVAQMAYSQMNRPNILAQYAPPMPTVFVPAITMPDAGIPAEITHREHFAAALREVPLYASLVEELPRLLNFVDELP